jgi:hypothetical protein
MSELTGLDNHGKADFRAVPQFLAKLPTCPRTRWKELTEGGEARQEEESFDSPSLAEGLAKVSKN